MSRLRIEKFHIRFGTSTTPVAPLTPRCYTLTHSDRTGDLFLTIAGEYDDSQISGWYTRLMRDEVLAEWQSGKTGMELHVYCHVSGGIVFGPARLRSFIFRRELPLALESFRYGDRALYEAYPDLENADIWVHFQSHRQRYHHIEKWGSPLDYRI